jgi:hypothetical protein
MRDPRNNAVSKKTLSKNIGGVRIQSHKCKSRYHLILQSPEGGRSEKFNYITIIMIAEDFSERDARELLGERVGDFLYDDQDHKVLTDIEDNAGDISCVNLVYKHDNDTCDVYDRVCIDIGCRFKVCGVRHYTAFLRPIPRIRH